MGPMRMVGSGGQQQLVRGPVTLHHLPGTMGDGGPQQQLVRGPVTLHHLQGAMGVDGGPHQPPPPPYPGQPPPYPRPQVSHSLMAFGYTSKLPQWVDSWCPTMDAGALTV